MDVWICANGSNRNGEQAVTDSRRKVSGILGSS